jgi:hypothetical protein
MLSPAARCDRIIDLIDACLAEVGAPSRAAGDAAKATKETAR